MVFGQAQVSYGIGLLVILKVYKMSYKREVLCRINFKM